MSRRDRTSIVPALVAAAVLHVGALVAVIVFGAMFAKPLKMGGGVPVTLVAEGPPILRDAPRAEVEQVAQVEEPAPLPPEPEPEPTPTPPTPRPTPPKPQAKPTPPAPSPTGKKPTQSKPLDLDRLLSDVESSRPKPPKPGGGRRGPPKPAGTVAPGQAPGEISQASRGYLNKLGEDLGRGWHPNCEVAGGDQVALTIQIVLGANGRLADDPKVIRGAKDDPVTRAAISRAIFAVRAAQPYRDFPAELIGEKLNFNLNAQAACAM